MYLPLKQINIMEKNTHEIIAKAFWVLNISETQYVHVSLHTTKW